MEITQSGQQTENQMKKHESNIRDLWDNMKQVNLHIRGIPEGRIDDRLKNYFEMSNPTVAPYAKEGCVHVRIAMKGDRGSSDYLIAEIDKIADEIKEIYPQAVEIKEN